MYNQYQYHEIAEASAHYIASALREAEQDRLVQEAESAQPRKPHFYNRIAAYLRGKLHFQAQSPVNNPEFRPSHSVSVVE